MFHLMGANNRLVPAAAVAALLAVAAQAPAQGQTLERIATAKDVRVGFVADEPPFTFDSGTPQGYAIDLCRVVVQQIAIRVHGLTTTFVETGPDYGFNAVADGDIDLLCGAMTETLQRREMVDFSEPIFVSGISAVVHPEAPRILHELAFGDREISPPRSLELTPFARLRLGVRTGTTTEEQLRRAVAAGSYDADIIGYSNHHEGITAIRAGKIDAYFADRGLLDGLLAASGGAGGLMLGSRLLSREPYAIAMRRGDSNLRLLVDRALTRFYQTPAFAELLTRYFGDDAGDIREQIIGFSVPE
jgi:polar amino acid transport system substrate-binding protein